MQIERLQHDPILGPLNTVDLTRPKYIRPHNAFATKALHLLVFAFIHFKNGQIGRSSVIQLPSTRIAVPVGHITQPAVGDSHGGILKERQLSFTYFRVALSLC